MSEPRFKLDAEQAAAAAALDGNVLLSAGAGCGKTKTLVERYVNILRERRAAVHEVAAITFTEKAANELKGRIRARIAELGGEAADAAEKALWRENLAAVESAAISTIHGFCAGVLREFPVDAEIDPGFSVAEEIEAADLRGAAVRDVLYDAVEAEDAAAGRLLAQYEFAALSGMLAAGLESREKISAARARLNLDGGEDAVATRLAGEAADAAGKLATSALSSSKFEALASRIEGEAGPEGDAIAEKRRAFLAALADWREGNLTPRQAADRLLGAIGQMRGGSAAKWGGERFAQMKAWLEAARDILKEAGGFLDCTTQEDWSARARDAKDFLRLHDLSAARYEELKRERGLLDFDDLLIRARDLLRTKPGIASAIAGRRRFILVDEFQDTDHLQAEIIGAIAGAGGRGGANFFGVGDPVQSIYSFRGAEVEVFSTLRNQYAAGKGGGVMTLSSNYRTLPHILNFVNVLFARLMPAGWAVPYAPLRATRAAGGPERVEIALCAPEGNLYEARRIEAEAIARRIARMLGEEIVSHADKDGGVSFRAARPGDIAILFRSMSDIYIYERALQEAGIRFYTVAGSTFFMRQEVRNLINLLRFIVDGEDTLSLVGALRSPLFAVSDDYLAILAGERGLSEYFDEGAAPPAPAAGANEADAAAFARAVALVGELRRIKNRVPIRRVIERIFEATGFLAALAPGFAGGQSVANVLKVRDIAARFDARGRATLEDFVAHVADLEEGQARESQALFEGAEGEAVRLMTVHAAKGLEFPVVILADAGRKKGAGRDGGGQGLVDRERGICLPLPGGGRGDRRKRPYYEILKTLERGREEAEELRVFFVAATRAQDCLIISASAGRRAGDEPAKVEGWMGAMLDALEISTDASGERVIGGTTVEFSIHEKSQGGRTAEKAAWPAMAKAILAGRTLKAQTGADEAELAAAAAPLPAGLASPSRLTATQISDFVQCPLRYELLHLRKLPADFVLKEEDAGGPRRLAGNVAGTILHDALAHAISRGGKLADALDEVIAGNAESGESKKLIVETCAPILRAVESSDFYRELLAGAARASAELPFAFTLDGRIIEGQMDLVLDGRIVDYKSDDIAAANVEAHAEGYRPQMDVYALAHEALFGRAPEAVAMFFLRPAKAVIWAYGGAAMESARRRVMDSIAALSAGPPFAPAAEGACRCEYGSICRIIYARRSTGGRAAPRPSS